MDVRKHGILEILSPQSILLVSSFPRMKSSNTEVYQILTSSFKLWKGLENGLIPNGLKINKRPTIKLVSENLFEKWNTIQFTTEQDLFKLLLKESLQVVNSLDKAIDKEIQKMNPIQIAEKTKGLNNSMEIIERN